MTQSHFMRTAVFVALSVFACADAQAESSFFKAGEKVVFLGDSITHQGRYLRFLSDYYLSRWPTSSFDFRSAGVSGDTTRRCLDRLAEDVYGQKPDVIHILFGMNDVQYWLYSQGKGNEERDAAITAFPSNLCTLVSALRTNCPLSRLVLMTPTPYDETAKGHETAFMGVNSKGLTALAASVREIGHRLGIEVVDLHAPMTRYMSEQQKVNPAYSPCDPDRIHPDSAGALILAKTMLDAQGVPALVAEIRIDAESLLDAGSKNVEVSKLVRENNGITFQAKELSLPFVVPEEIANDAPGIGIDAMNQERLVVRGLKRGEYQVLCDECEVGCFSSDQLLQGVNLAVLTNAPGYRQAMRVDALNAKRCAFEADRLRGMACVRWYLRRQGVDVDDFSVMREYIEKKILPKERKNYYEGFMAAYLSDWPRREELVREFEMMGREIDAIRRPRAYRWRIVPVEPHKASLLVFNEGGNQSTNETIRLVDLVDFSESLGVVHCHGAAKAEATRQTEGDSCYLRLSLDPADRSWAGLRFNAAIPKGTSALEFIFRTSDQGTANATITVCDSSGQNYQFALKSLGGPDWTTSRLDLTEKPFNQWKNGGGSPNGLIHFPILSVSIDCASGTGFDLFRYRAVTTASPEVLPDFAIIAHPEKEHGLWHSEDILRYSIDIRRRAHDATLPDAVDWTLFDFWGGQILSTGHWTKGHGDLTIDREMMKDRYGSFKLTLTAGEGIRRVSREVWFARLKGDDPGPCEWIGTIGGGFSWDLFRAMGVGRMNCSLGWNMCETKKGEYVFPEWFDTYITNMVAHGIKPHLMAHKPNPTYENPLDPVAFAKYISAYARHFAELGVDTIEIWNEPRGVFRKQYGEESRIGKFVEFSRMARDAVKASVPDMTVVVGAEDMGFDLLPMIGLGIARPGDAISFHPYCHTQPRPERSYFFSDNGRAIRNLAKSCGGATKFRISELGWTTFTGEGEYLEIAGFYPRASYEHQAQYLVRSFIMARQSGVDYLCQYRFEDMSRRNYTEHNFGFVFEDYTPKPSFCAMAFMARLLGKAEPSGALSDDLDRYRVSSFVRGGRKLLACWAVEKPTEWTLPNDFGKVVQCYDLMGNEIAPPYSKGRTLRLTERPIYIVGEK